MKKEYRRKTEQFVALPYKMLDSPHWIALTHSARTLYAYIKRQRDTIDSRGRKINRSDDSLQIGYADVRHVMSKDTFRKSKADLINRGFIDVVTPGKFPNVKTVVSLSGRWQQADPNPQLFDSPF
ncbi:hypothetical protein Dalk_4573 [Desulfatibacillum aliphaticivorans]|uniref:Uncharacterized protein n=1 Tax=Desulfatibacillum aliphaticivorans TaxID=218208 RepID=B8FNH0_DESAL|nr:hypothetical protein [Desulfatibacillum aliphaticivorans]ACL06251.1 hypothetical protein Dalk_4573 [Desulfatibacillum aliphaticivorans]